MKTCQSCLRSYRYFPAILMSLVLAACGGGGSSGGGTVPGGGSGGSTPSISVASSSVTEGDSGTVDLAFTVTLSAAASGDVTVDYATSDISATAGSDYTAANGTLTIPAGSTSADVTISVNGDTDQESNETFQLTLSNPVGATLGTATATGTINDDDSTITPLPTISIADASVAEGDSGTATLSFTLSLSTPASSNISVDYVSSDGTAQAGSDYTAVNSTAMILAGSTATTISVDIIGDTAVESDETFTIILSNPIGAGLAVGTATGTITNDDTATPPPPPPGGGTTSLLFYNSGSISTVDPDSPATAPVQVEAAITAEEASLFDGTIDFAAQQVTDIDNRTVIYVNYDDGRIYRISARKSDSQIPVQVSNETEAGTYCETESDWAIDFADHNNSSYFYRLSGADSTCGTADDVWKMVRVGMGSTESPIVAKEMALELYNASNGALTGFLALDGQKIVRCNLTFSSCSDVISYSFQGEVLDDNPFIGGVILWIDDKLYHYDIATGALSNALHTFTGTFMPGLPPTFVPSDSDRTTLYFADGDKLYKLPMDGSASSTLLATALNSGSGRSIADVNLTTGRVVYMARAASFTGALESVSKSGGTPTTLVDTGVLMFQTAGSLVYYDKLDLVPLFGVVNDDGSNRSESPNARMSGFVMAADETTIKKIMWTDGCASATSCSGATLKSVDAATNGNPLALGTIPADIDLFAVFGLNSKLLGFGGLSGSSGTQASDVFYVDVNQAGSLRRITTTSSIDEYPISF